MDQEVLLFVTARMKVHLFRTHQSLVSIFPLQHGAVSTSQNAFNTSNSE